MKILILAPANSFHTIRWIQALRDSGNDVVLFSLGSVDPLKYKGYTGITVIHFQDECEAKNKISLFFQAILRLKKLLKKIKPDIVHAHYATSYGFLGALSGFNPFVVSVWGSDVFSFPRKSILHRFFLKYIFRSADHIFSTSEVMAQEVQLYSNKLIEVTPFGIDLEKFKNQSCGGRETIVIGAIKNIEKIYGHSYLINAFNILARKYDNIELLIVGKGSCKKDLQILIDKFNLSDKVNFVGQVDNNEIPKYLNKMDIFCNLSFHESFGVSVIEASACELPVVATNVGGLAEVIEDGVTGFLVPPKEFMITSAAIEKLILDKHLRRNIGLAGRDRIYKYYNWQENVNHMVNLYKKILK